MMVVVIQQSKTSNPSRLGQIYKGVCVIKSTIIPDYLHEFKKTFDPKIVYNPRVSNRIKMQMRTLKIPFPSVWW